MRMQLQGGLKAVITHETESSRSDVHLAQRTKKTAFQARSFQLWKDKWKIRFRTVFAEASWITDYKIAL